MTDHSNHPINLLFSLPMFEPCPMVTEPSPFLSPLPLNNSPSRTPRPHHLPFVRLDSNLNCIGKHFFLLVFAIVYIFFFGSSCCVLLYVTLFFKPHLVCTIWIDKDRYIKGTLLLSYEARLVSVIQGLQLH